MSATPPCPGTNPKGYPITMANHCPGCVKRDQPPSSETLTEEQRGFFATIRRDYAPCRHEQSHRVDTRCDVNQLADIIDTLLAEVAALRAASEREQHGRCQCCREVAALWEDHVALANVSGALCDAGGIVPAEAWRYGEAVRAIAAERDRLLAALQALSFTRPDRSICYDAGRCKNRKELLLDDPAGVRHFVEHSPHCEEARRALGV